LIGRPTHREISRKIRVAQQAVELRAIQIVDFMSLLSDADELGYSFDELPEILAKLLSHAAYSNYAVSRAPAKIL